MIGIYDGSLVGIENSTIMATSASGGLELGGSSRLEFRNSKISGSVTDNLAGVSEGSSAKIEDSSTLTITSAEQGLRVSDSSRLNFRDSTISGTVVGALISVDAGSSAEVRDATLTFESGAQAVSVKSSSYLKIRSSTISGTATKELVDVRRVPHLIIDGSTLSQTASDTPDVRVSKLSFLSVFDDSSINSVDCHMKGTVDTDVSITDLDTGCTD